MASRDKFDVDTLHKSIQYALEKLGKSKSGFERTAVSNFKSKKHEGSGNELVDYSRAPCLGADQKARGLWERDWEVVTSHPVMRALIYSFIFPNRQTQRTNAYSVKKIYLFLENNDQYVCKKYFSTVVLLYDERFSSTFSRINRQTSIPIEKCFKLGSKAVRPCR